MWISKDVETLLTTGDPTSDGPVGRIGPFSKARVVLIRLGHGREAHPDPSFRRLVQDAVFRATGR